MSYTAMEHMGVVLQFVIHHQVSYCPICIPLCTIPLFQVVHGEFTSFTGVPNSGKSEWIVVLLCNIRTQCWWKFVLCPMENIKKSWSSPKLFIKNRILPSTNIIYISP